MPTSASAGTRWWRNSSSARATSSATRSVISESCTVGVSPSGDSPPTPPATWSDRPAMRTWKNSSRFWLKIAQNLVRSSSGTEGSAASSSTRALKSSHDSSRFKNRSGTSAMVASITGRVATATVGPTTDR